MLYSVVPPAYFVLSPFVISNAYSLLFPFSFLLSLLPVPCLCLMFPSCRLSGMPDLFHLSDVVMSFSHNFLAGNERYQGKERSVDRFLVDLALSLN